MVFFSKIRRIHWRIQICCVARSDSRCLKSYDTEFTLLIIPDDWIYYFGECWLLLITENGLNSSVVNKSFFAMQLVLVPVAVPYRIDLQNLHLTNVAFSRLRHIPCTMCLWCSYGVGVSEQAAKVSRGGVAKASPLLNSSRVRDLRTSFRAPLPGMMMRPMRGLVSAHTLCRPTAD